MEFLKNKAETIWVFQIGNKKPQGMYRQDQESWSHFQDHALSSHLITVETVAEGEGH